ncbi:PIR Superfamily Protein [Plasmodium ovale curtisi]|uniref:PIR Superfamily Protein n=1 Tax=Plasmodium ovale curtisi TaxID=864141 RepID=A0A1A8WXC0_PLAOA|nr:PIR Superfamily Protein [Plasmodium ovale curtisi]
MGKINEDNLPSNRYKKDILTNSEIDRLINTCITLNRESECIDEIIALDTKLYTRYRSVRTQCNSSRADPRCCRDMNYCIDNIISIIKSSEFKDSYKREYIKIVEDYWQDIFDKKHEYVCKREKETHSTYERCILGQLYDYNDDKSYLRTNIQEDENIFQEYDKYLEEKWSRIFKSEKSNNEDIKISINDKSIEKTVKSNNSPLTYTILSSIITDTITNISVIFSPEATKIFTKGGHSKAGVEESKMTHGKDSAETDPPMETEPVDETNSALTRIIVTVISMFLGIFFLFLMLYKFSPLGSLVNNQVKKRGKIQKTLDYEKTELVEPEDNQYYIRYDHSSY